ncbi:DUF3754 domain-containing protein [Oceanibium sediminis]|uniref:DUF3754 domain-containing protein n=1 Tax=Oceanibium sediminis TaxID=2026339 RepID=UPI000DD34193|nr:DUF3754 domain-containing protein [Oceanibium sediminis]
MTGTTDSAGVPERDRFIPIGKADLVDALARRKGLDEDRVALLESLARWFSLLFHLEFFAQREVLKDRYTVLDPDQPGDGPVPGSLPQAVEFLDQLEKSLQAANFRRLTEQEVGVDSAAAGRVRARVVVPHTTYGAVRFYGRGRWMQTYTLKSFFGLRKQLVKEPVYDFVVFAAAAADDSTLAPRERGRLRPGALYLKLFRDIPQGDLTTLYPNARVVMKLFDKLVIGVPAIVGGLPILINIVPTVTVLLIVLGAYLGISGTVEEDSLKQALAALSGLGALGGFLLRQWTKYERQKLRYQKQVLDNAYFNTINNNRGFFDFVIGASEDSEVKEAILAYVFLSEADGPLSEAELDSRIECWLRVETGKDIDFEVDDALRKLRALGVLVERDGRFSAVPGLDAEAACRALWARMAEEVTRPGAEALIGGHETRAQGVLT